MKPGKVQKRCSLPSECLISKKNSTDVITAIHAFLVASITHLIRTIKTGLHIFTWCKLVLKGIISYTVFISSVQIIGDAFLKLNSVFVFLLPIALIPVLLLCSALFHRIAPSAVFCFYWKPAAESPVNLPLRRTLVPHSACSTTTFLEGDFMPGQILKSLLKINGYWHC